MSLLSQMSGGTKNILKALRNSRFTGPISFFYQSPSRKQESKEVSPKALIIQSADIILSAPLILNFTALHFSHRAKSNFCKHGPLSCCLLWLVFCFYPIPPSFRLLKFQGSLWHRKLSVCGMSIL